MDRMLEQLAERVNDDCDDVVADDVEVLGLPDANEVEHELARMLKEAAANGFDPARMGEVRDLVKRFTDVWSIRIGQGQAADVEPLHVRLVDGPVRYRAAVRRYPETQRQFLREYVRELEEAGLIYRNNSSRWACAALPVRKADGGFRITVDYRPVNKLTAPLAGAAPNLGVVMQCVEGAYGFGKFDFLKGFWQMPLHADHQEMFSFVTEDGIFTPRRVPQGASDSAVYFQLQMGDVLRDMLHRAALVWIDNVLLHAHDARAYLRNLEDFFVILRTRRLKLNARKCALFAKRVN